MIMTLILNSIKKFVITLVRRMAMSIYIVDYENVKGKGFNGVEKLLDTDIVIVFYSINQYSMNINDVKKILASKAKVVFKEANVKLDGSNKSYHDALDVQLATYVGYYIGKNGSQDTNYYVVSEDKGFSFLCKFWENRGYKFNQIDCISKGDTKAEKENIRSNILKSIGDEKLAASISKIIINHKTKDGIYKSLVKKYGEEKGLEYYNEVKPLIKDKK